jgi:hypothetical protein
VALEDAAGVHLLQRRVGAVGHHHVDLGGRRPERADHHARAIVRVGTEVPVRIGMLTVDQKVGVAHF